MSRLIRAEETMSIALGVNLVDCAINTMTSDGGIADRIASVANKGGFSVLVDINELGWVERERDVAKRILNYLGYSVDQQGRDKYNISWVLDRFGPKTTVEFPLTDNELDIKLGFKSGE